jgi:DNA-binding transcriptional ArsR family regulator
VDITIFLDENFFRRLSYPSPVAQLAALDIIRHPDRATALLQPGRQDIVERLAEPDSASGLARRLNIPRQRLNYHLRELERAGLVELVEERRKGNCVERIVRATARSFLISPEALGSLGAAPDRTRDRFSPTHLVTTAARVIRDLAVLVARARAANKRLATLTLFTDIRFATPADRAAFTDELTTELGRLKAKYHQEHAPAGRTFHLWTGAYPAIRTDTNSAE